MLNFFTIILGMFISFSVYAYEPTNFTGDKQEVRSFFDSLWKQFKSYDYTHCYRRAHILSYEMSKRGFYPMKVFYFAGDQLQSDHGWWYHVAPMIYHKGDAVVLDRGLHEGATYLKDWTDSLSKDYDCEEIKSFEEYRQKKSTTYCMYLVTNMYVYGPNNLENPMTMKFEQADLMDMLYSLPKGQRQKYLKQYPIQY